MREVIQFYYTNQYATMKEANVRANSP